MTENFNEQFDTSELDRIFEQYPSPQPAPALVDEIKRKINLRKRVNVAAVILKTAITTAAVILIAVFLPTDIKQTATQESGEVSLVFSEQGYEAIAALEMEIDIINSELIALMLNEENGTGNLLTDSLTNLEADLYATDSTFWKG